MTLGKGERMEEMLRSYFLSSGFYVARSVKYIYLDNVITDIDLWLYSRMATLKRYRVNVDIKHKKVPQALERVFWAKGIREILKLDDCIVATTDKRTHIRNFGTLNGVKVIDGNFLSRIKNVDYDRMTEEDFFNSFPKQTRQNGIKDWKQIYEKSKSRLIVELDYSGCNSSLEDARFFIEQILINTVDRVAATRTLYAIMSHTLIILDFLLANLSFLETDTRAEKLSEGFKYGNLGSSGFERLIDIVLQINSDFDINSSNVDSIFQNDPIDIIKDFFSRNDVAKNLFKYAREFENYAFASTFIRPDELSDDLKSIISVILDFSQISRSKFFNAFNNSDDIYVEASL